MRPITVLAAWPSCRRTTYPGADPDPKAEGCEDETYIFSFAVVNQRHSMLLYNIIITHSTKMSSMISYTLNVKIYK